MSGNRQKKGGPPKRRGSSSNGAGDSQRSEVGRSAGGDNVFDRWLEDKLRNSYSSVLDEPIPEDLLRLLEQKLKD